MARHPGNSPITAELLREARADFARIRALLVLRYQREGRPLLRRWDVRPELPRFSADPAPLSKPEGPQEPQT